MGRYDGQLNSCPRWFVVLLFLSLVSPMASAQFMVLPDPDPATYASFVVVQKSPTVADLAPSNDLAHLISNSPSNAFFLAHGDHIVNNCDGPVKVTSDLYIHGGNQKRTRLVACNPEHAMFEITDPPDSTEPFTVNFTGVRIWPGPSSNFTRPWRGNGPKSIKTNSVAVHVTTQDVAVDFQMQDSNVHHSQIHAEGKGSYRFQAVLLSPAGHVTTPLLVDHPEAVVTVVGGDIAHGRDFPREGVDPDEIYQIRQKRGHLQVFGTSMERALGDANIRIDTPAPLGEFHVLANIRSEGTNGYNDTPSALLYVPDTTAQVDVIVKNCSGQWRYAPAPGESHLVDYRGNGTLWLLGNNSVVGAGSMVLGLDDPNGTRPDVKVIAIGNLIFSNNPLPADPDGDGVDEVIAAGNMYNYAGVHAALREDGTIDSTVCGLGFSAFSCCYPSFRFLEPQGTLYSTLR